MACQAANLPEGTVVYPLVGTVDGVYNALDQALPPPITMRTNEALPSCQASMSFGSLQDMSATCAAQQSELVDVQCSPSFEFSDDATHEEFAAQWAVCSDAVQGVEGQTAKFEACGRVPNCMPTGQCQDISMLMAGGTLQQLNDFCSAEQQGTPVTGAYYIDAGTQCVGPFTTHDAMTSDVARVKTISPEAVPARQQECAANRGELYVVSCDADPTVYPQEDRQMRQLGQIQCATAVSTATTMDEVKTLCAAQDGCVPTARCLFKPENSRTMAVPPATTYEATDSLKSIGDCTDEACTQVAIAPHYFDSNSGKWQRLQPGDSALGDYFLNENYRDSCQLPMRYGRALSPAIPGAAKVLIPNVIPDMTVFSTCMERGDCEDLVHRLEGCATGNQSAYFNQTCHRPGFDLCDIVDELHQRKTNGKQERTAPAVSRTCLRTKISKIHNGVKACAFANKGSAEDFCKPWDPAYQPDDKTETVKRASDASAAAFQQCKDDFNALDDEAFERMCQVTEIVPMAPPCTFRSDVGDNLCAELQVMDNYISTTMGYQAQANWQRVKQQTYPHIGCDKLPLQRLEDAPARCVAKFNAPAPGTTDESCMRHIDSAASDADARKNCTDAGCQYQPQRDAVTLLNVTNRFTDLANARMAESGNSLGFYGGFTVAAAHKGYETLHKLTGGTTDVETNAIIAQGRREDREAQAAEEEAQNLAEQQARSARIDQNIAAWRAANPEQSALRPEPTMGDWKPSYTGPEPAPTTHPVNSRLARMQYANAQAQASAAELGDGGNAVTVRPETQQEVQASYETANAQASSLDGATVQIDSISTTEHTSGDGEFDAEAETDLMEDELITGL